MAGASGDDDGAGIMEQARRSCAGIAISLDRDARASERREPGHDIALQQLLDAVDRLVGLALQQAGNLGQRLLARVDPVERALARHGLDAGCRVLVDATFLKRAERDRFRQLADQAGVPFLILACSAAPEVLRQRILSRQASGGDPSEAGIDVLEAQLASLEPPAEDEQGDIVMPAPEDAESPVALAERIAGRLG